MWVVELEPGVWRSSWGVTLVKEAAKPYKTELGGMCALQRYRRTTRRTVIDAKVYEITQAPAPGQEGCENG